MADISLYLTNVNVSIGQNMAVEQTQGPKPGKDFESVELGERERGEEPQQREKVPRRIIHFSSGETMEEYSTDEEDGEPERKDLLSSPGDASKMTWGPYFWFHMWRAATSTVSELVGESLSPFPTVITFPPCAARQQHRVWKRQTVEVVVATACDYLGERMASLFGITSAKYQYAIDEYYRIKKEREEEKEENRLSEEAERSFDQLQSQGDEDEPIAVSDRPEVSAAHPEVAYQIEDENQRKDIQTRCLLMGFNTAFSWKIIGAALRGIQS
ncbi:protein FAM177A1 isoform X2 [Scophthalmus maximus]|uniref:protein FAM177A1 isoform X2 n=1 Tax=Scophthalmus maximus TaxID=52904 RepID=UPI001FA85700|nr:protein FAM177A1 isoform X2 [Scophthalmus maximus]